MVVVVVVVVVVAFFLGGGGAGWGELTAWGFPLIMLTFNNN